MKAQTLRDRLWLWGMKVNVLQEHDDYSTLNFGTSTLTVEGAIKKTGITNVIMAGHLDIDTTSLAAMPSAKRIICKTSIHRHEGGKTVMNEERCRALLLDAKRLAAADTRIEAFHIDDFSTGSLDAGAAPEHLARLQFLNAVAAPQLPLGGTMYTMSLERPELPPVLPFFAFYLVPLWHAEQIDTVPAALDRLAALSGNKPMMLCLYCYDFGISKPIPRPLMQRHLDLAEKLILDRKVTGMCLCGTCMMDLEWESNHCFYEWLDKKGNREVAE
jgi:hypothetical protein